MRTKTVTLIAGSVTALVLILLAVLWPTVGPKKAAIVIACSSAFVTVIILLYLLIRRVMSTFRRHSSVQRRLSLGAGTDPQLQFSFLRKVAGLPVNYTYKDLEAATDSFRSPIGRGSSGSVFRGILDDGTVVAVKRIDRSAEQSDRDFRSEVAVIASIQHVNLIRLLGFCVHPGDSRRLLVYEFARHGSLDKWIFPGGQFASVDEPRFLPWAVRVRVAVEVAKALAYLHHDCRSRVLHLDVKPENVLLGEGFHALVADFGLSKMMGRDESRVVTSLRGTRGYLAPEWLMERGVTEKSDVYSYGMLLLEMVGGRRNCLLVEEDGGEEGRRRRMWSYFPAIVAERVKEGRVMEVVDGRMGVGEVEEEEVMRAVSVALWCIQEEGRMRPSMARVVDMLEGRMGTVEAPPETNMIMAEYLDVDMLEGSASAVAHLRSPEASAYSFAMTMLSGR